MGESGSAAWWRRSHNRHHASAQHKGHDTDLETLPFLAYDVLTGKDANPYLIRFQVLNFFVGASFVITFWKFYLHPLNIIKRKKFMDGGFLILHWVLWFLIFTPTLGVFQTFMLSIYVGSVQGSYLFLNFSLSHTHMPVLEKEDQCDWVRKAFNYTVDIDSGTFNWVDYWMG
jgi:fatty acid desaturase